MAHGPKRRAQSLLACQPVRRCQQLCVAAMADFTVCAVSLRALFRFVLLALLLAGHQV